MAHFIQLGLVTETYKKFMDVATVLSLLLLKCAIKKRQTQNPIFVILSKAEIWQRLVNKFVRISINSMW